MNYKEGYTPFVLNCNFIGATGLSLNNVCFNDNNTMSVWYNVERNELRSFQIEIAYFLVRDAR